jgi:hypothetical protein
VSERFDERQAIVAFIRKRCAGVDHFVRQGRLSATEGSDLKRWLDTLADDIDAQLHDDEPAADGD